MGRWSIHLLGGTWRSMQLHRGSRGHGSGFHGCMAHETQDRCPPELPPDAEREGCLQLPSLYRSWPCLLSVCSPILQEVSFNMFVFLPECLSSSLCLSLSLSPTFSFTQSRSLPLPACLSAPLPSVCPCLRQVPDPVHSAHPPRRPLASLLESWQNGGESER